MDSKEFGLVFGHKLLGLDHLHYGYWEESDKLSLGGLIKAQERYTDLLLSTLKGHLDAGDNSRILDVGCGTGSILCRLLKEGYTTDGVIPSDYLYGVVNEKLAALRKKNPHLRSRIFHCGFEDLPVESLDGKYDMVFFSESFQYVRSSAAYPVLDAILKPTGRVLICDFFKLDAGTDNALFGGGHRLSSFYARLQEREWRILLDRDITANMSPSIELLEKLMKRRAVPALGILDEFLAASYPLAYRTFRLALRPQLQKMRKKYFAGSRTRGNFEKHKSYRLLVLEREKRESS